MEDQEAIVAKMVENGRKVVEDAAKEFGASVIMAAFSGGDDSIVATHFAMTNYKEAFVITADTMIGLPQTRDHQASVCDRFGWRREVEQATARGCPRKMRTPDGMKPFDPSVRLASGKWEDGATAYEEFVLNYGFPGRGKPQHRLMYQKLKEICFRRILRRHGVSKSKKGKRAIVISGIRHDESSIRAGYKRAWAEGYFGEIWVNPFYWNTKADFCMYRDEFGLPTNPVKARCGISGECLCGTFAETDERAAVKAISPETDQYLSDLESRCREKGMDWGWGQSPPPEWAESSKERKKILEEMYPKETHFQPACVGCNSGRK